MENAKVIVAGILLWLVQIVVPNIPHWVIYIGISVCVVVLIWLNKPSKVTVSQSSPRRNHDTTQTYKNVIRMRQQEPSRRPPKILTIGQIILSALMLFFGIYILVHMTQGIQFGIGAILFLVLLLGLPSFILVDALWLQRKQYKLGKSGAAKEQDLTLPGDIYEVFAKVIRVANIMRITPYKINRPHTFIGHSQKSILYSTSVITITARRLPKGGVKVHILSDAEWVTVKWDIFGHNQRNVNNFVRLMSSESGYLEKSPTVTQTSMPTALDKLKVPSPPQLGILYQKHKIEFDGQVPIITVYAEYRPHGLGEMRIESIELQLLGQRVSCLDWKVVKISEDIWISSDNKFRLPVGISSGEHDVKLTAFANGEWWSSQPFTITTLEVNS